MKGRTIEPARPGDEPLPGDQVELGLAVVNERVILVTGISIPIALEAEDAYKLGQALVESAIAAGGETKEG